MSRPYSWWVGISALKTKQRQPRLPLCRCENTQEQSTPERAPRPAKKSWYPVTFRIADNLRRNHLESAVLSEMAIFCNCCDLGHRVQGRSHNEVLGLISLSSFLWTLSGASCAPIAGEFVVSTVRPTVLRLVRSIHPEAVAYARF